MKKLLFLAVLLPAICNLSAQNVSDDVLLLKKSNASLKTQLNEQKHTLLTQIQKTDSIISILQSANSEIQKSADDQKSFTQQSISELKQETANISASLGKRKLYAIVAVIITMVVGLIYLLYLRKKFVVINNNIKQNDEILNNKISQMNEHIDNEISEIKAIFEKQATENNNSLAKLSTVTNENINKMSSEVDKTIESQIISVKGTVQEQLSQSANEYSNKITELNKTVEKEIAAIKNDVSANISEINEKLKKHVHQ